MIQKLEHCVRGTDYGCGGASFSEVIDKVNEVIDYINSLPEENNPEPYNPVYDEDYLNEKIAKATKSWEGVDVDKMLADCRGYEEKPSEGLEEAAKEIVIKMHPCMKDCTILGDRLTRGQLMALVKAGAEWQKEQDNNFERYKDYTDKVLISLEEARERGRQEMKEQMMKNAVEVDVDDLNGEIYNNCIEKGMTGKDKVKIIILKDGE